MQNAIAQIVCWHCRRGGGEKFQLFNVKQEKIVKKTDGSQQIMVVKSDDYICNSCKDAGFLKPETWNSSRVHIPTKEELEEINKRIKDIMALQAQPDVSEIIEGEVVEEESLPKPNIPFVDGVAVKEHVNVEITN